MHQYQRQRFLEASHTQRGELCAMLAGSLRSKLSSAAEFHDEVRRIVELLREAGHDLWSIDESGDFEVWGPNYHTPSGPGLVLTFFVAGGVEVDWTDNNP